MRKTLLLVIMILAATSIFVIGIFGAAAGQTIITIKVTSVEFNHSAEETVVDSNGNETKRINLTEGTTSYQLNWTVYPVKDEESGTEGATNTKVTFSSNNELVGVTSEGLVSFPSELTQSLSVVITVKTADGDYTDTITFFIKHTNSSVITDD